MISGLSESLTLTVILVLVFGSVSLYLYTRLTQTEQKISLIESILLDLKMASEMGRFDQEAEDENDKHMDGHVGHDSLDNENQRNSDDEVKTLNKDFKKFTNDSELEHFNEYEYNDLTKVLQKARSQTNNSSGVEFNADDDLEDGTLAKNVDVTTASRVPVESSPSNVLGVTDKATSRSPTENRKEYDSNTEFSETSAAAAAANLSSVSNLGSGEVVTITTVENLSSQDNTTLSSSVHPNLESMTAKELHALAKQRGIVGESKMTRSQLVDELSK